MSRCAICERSYRLRSNGSNGYCQQCARNIERETNRSKRRKTRQSWRFRLYKVVHHKGHLVGFYQKPGEPEKLQVKPLSVSVAGVPKSLLVDLDKYCPGYNRQQVKRMKMAVARAHGL